MERVRDDEKEHRCKRGMERVRDDEKEHRYKRDV